MLKKTVRPFLTRSFRQLLVKYVSFVIIPLLILLPFVEILLRESFESSYAQKLQDALDSAQGQVNYSLKMVDTICVSIDKSDSIVSSMLDINAYSRVSVCKLLNTYSILDPLYADLCLFSTQTPELIYSPIGTDLLSSLNPYNCFGGEGTPAGQLRDLRERRLYSNLVAADDSPLPVSHLRHSHSWLYICPGNVFSASAVTVLLRINTWTFYSMYSDVLRQYDSSDHAMITLDASGNVIGMTGSLYEGDALVSPSWLKAQLDGGDVAAVQTVHDNFTNYLLIDGAVVAAAIQPKLQAAHLAYVAVMLLALVLCCAVAIQIYRPVAMLRENILAGISEMPIDSSELQSIDHSIADIIRTYNRREEQSRHILDMTKQQLIYWALLNNLPRTEHTEQLLKLTGFNQPNMLFCALAIQLPSSPDPALVGNLCADIQRLDWNHSSVIAVWVPAHDTLAVVFHMFVELDTRARQEYAANTLHMILDQYSISSGIGVGLSQPTLFTLNRSYTTARRALSESSMPYCLFEDIRADENDRFSGCLQNLIARINDGNVDAARAELNRYLRLLAELTGKRALFQFYSARLLNDVSRPFVDMGIWHFDQLDAKIERLMFMDLDELSATLNALLDQVDANAAPGPSDEEPAERNSILASVHDHLMENALDPMLNINLEAEKFGMSTVTLNRRFRQRYGRTMVSFVSDIRMEKAKELLRTSDMRVKDIVTAVGYFDVPNFSRKFKATVGLTPGQYRQMERGDAIDGGDE